MAIDFICGHPFGTSVESVITSGFQVTEAVYAGGTRVPNHHHVVPAFSLVLAGGFQDRYPSDEVENSAGTALYYAPEDAHTTILGPDGARCLDITVDPSILHHHSSMTRALDRIRRSRQVVPRSEAMAISRAAEGEDDLSVGILRERVIILFANLLRVPNLRLGSNPPTWLRRVRDRLMEEWLDPPRHDELAEVAGVHRVHLVRSFRKYYGCTAGEFVRLRRVSAAVEALRRTDIPLSHLAFDLGFADQAHFTRTFRELVGIPPGKFRRMYVSDG